MYLDLEKWRHGEGGKSSTQTFYTDKKKQEVILALVYMKKDGEFLYLWYGMATFFKLKFVLYKSAFWIVSGDSHELIRRYLQNPVTLVWMPRHTDVAGNKIADQLARKVSEVAFAESKPSIAIRKNSSVQCNQKVDFTATATVLEPIE
ncbi:hypothetical protein Trydic_g20859 [Trypoxylus dichotomus]